MSQHYRHNGNSMMCPICREPFLYSSMQEFEERCQRGGLSLNRRFDEAAADEDDGQAEPDSWMVALCCNRVVCTSEPGSETSFHTINDRRMHLSRQDGVEEWSCLMCGNFVDSSLFLSRRASVRFCSEHNKNCSLVVDTHSGYLLYVCTTAGGHPSNDGCPFSPGGFYPAPLSEGPNLVHIVSSSEETVEADGNIPPMDPADDGEMSAGMSILESVVEPRIENIDMRDEELEILMRVMNSGLER